MKEMIKELVDTFINPRAIIQKKIDLKQEYQVKFDKSLYLKDYLKSRTWLEFNRPLIYKSLESGLGRLIRDGLTMNETELKSIIAEARASLNQVIQMKYDIEAGEDAGRKLEKLR